MTVLPKATASVDAGSKSRRTWLFARSQWAVFGCHLGWPLSRKKRPTEPGPLLDKLRGVSSGMVMTMYVLVFRFQCTTEEIDCDAGRISVLVGR